MIQSKRFLLYAGTKDSSGNPSGYSIVAYSPSGQKLGMYQIFTCNNSTSNQTTLTICDSLTTSDQYFGGRRLASMDQLGSVGTYYPWGEAKGTTNPQDTWSYATYWRDSVSALDYANNRYYTNAYGRFMTPDVYQASGSPSNPQSWNRYAYTRGDPINRFDPVGLDDCPPGQGVPGPNGDGWVCPGDPGGTGPGGTGVGQTPQQRKGSQPVGIPFKPTVDSSTNQWARGVLSKAFTNFAGSNCDKAFAAVIPNYNTQLFENYDNVANFYAAAGQDSGFTQNQVSGNGNNTTLGNTLGLGQTAVTLTSAQGAQIPAILLGNGIFNFQGAGDVLIHELLHAFTNWNDATVYQDFAKYGLVNPGDGSTSAISRWISTDCTKTPPDSAP